jgi:type IV fimbrial biogenesis protein FimT
MSDYVTNAPIAPRWRQARGFTAVELIMVMAVVGILIAIAVPAFKSFIQNSRLSTHANTLVYSLNLARSSAIKFDTSVVVCASSDGATCNGPADWSTGWIVCYPAASCGPGGGPPAPTLLESSPQLGTGTVTEQNAALAVTYLSTGQTNNVVGGTTYRFVFCDNRGPAFGQDVEINYTGRIQAATTQGFLVNGTTPLGAC